MSKPPSEATQLRYAKKDLAELKIALGRQQQLTEGYRVRATKAEQEAAEWKARFDALLRRDEAKK